MGDTTGKSGKGCGGLAGGILIGIALAVAAVFGLMSLMVERFPAMPRTDQIERIRVVGGDLYVEASLADDSTVWIRSRDGGVSWEKIAEPGDDVTVQRGVDTSCTDEGVCYLLQLVNGAETNEEYPSVVQIRRMAKNGTWRTEAEFDRWDECDASRLQVDHGTSERAMVECTSSTVAIRTHSGDWQLRDVVVLARTLR